MAFQPRFALNIEKSWDRRPQIFQLLSPIQQQTQMAIAR